MFHLRMKSWAIISKSLGIRGYATISVFKKIMFEGRENEINVRIEVVALFPLECSVLLIVRSDPFRTKIASPLYRQLQLGLTISLTMLVKIAAFSTDRV